MTFTLSKASEEKLVGVHPDLVRVVRRAIEITPIDFRVTEGLRTLERQKQLKAEGKSKTLKSRHLTGHAIDFVALPAGAVSWDLKFYRQITDAFKRAAVELRIPIVCGIDWSGFVDGPHVELLTSVYP